MPHHPLMLPVDAHDSKSYWRMQGLINGQYRKEQKQRQKHWQQELKIVKNFASPYYSPASCNLLYCLPK